MAKKLLRNSSNKMLAGVCSGLGDYFHIDATIVRIIFLILFFGYGTGVFIYIILWIIVPGDIKHIF